ncbi:uncharacterized protein BO97DRAFT_77678 [Aspergillus homomorphus CBS 101889]|uniref:Uncharacterized protein n=1 Tax=Aspergillus homomorphus (strain CBS 101889) TaxID=1450537 RepID=A0A395IA21_ASPHC|nr:hypothetical protein BO97DRAFT_77678 [Aspergillus homomorphus CBS 101889]RAL16871.1 hypothetical protein BO97DRAFT_77678 [Aspergillus homomorphus CBS 101889]
MRDCIRTLVNIQSAKLVFLWLKSPFRRRIYKPLEKPELNRSEYSLSMRVVSVLPLLTGLVNCCLATYVTFKFPINAPGYGGQHLHGSQP